MTPEKLKALKPGIKLDPSKEKDSGWKLSAAEYQAKVGFQNLIDGSFFYQFALKVIKKKGGTRRRLAYKIYVPEQKAELFTIFGIYLKLLGVKSISHWVAEKITSELESIEGTSVFEQATQIFNDFKVQQMRASVLETELKKS